MTTNEQTATDTGLRLVAPTVALERTYRSYLEELRAAGENLQPGILARRAIDFEVLVQSLHDNARGVALGAGQVPASTHWLVDAEGELVGVAHFRHRLTPLLEREGGHIGYGVRPSRRRRGAATRLLALMLEEARRLGLSRVLLVCDKDNLASAAVIRANGGVLENEVVSSRTGRIVQRYWIELDGGGEAAR